MSDNSLNRSEWQAGLSLSAVYVLRMLGLFMVIPVIAVAALEYPDYSPLWVGLAIGGYGLTQAIFQIPMGLLSDRIGRKPVIYMGLLLFSIGSFVAGFADSMCILTIGRVMQGSGAIAGAVMALASDVTRESQRTKVMALIGVSIGLSFYVALLLGPIIASKLGMSGIFYITAILSLFCIPLIKFGVYVETKGQATGDALPKLNLIPKLYKHKHLWRLNSSVLVIHMLITSFFVQVPVQLTNLGVPLSEHWMLYAIVFFVSVLFLVVMLKVVDKLKVALSFRIALLFMASAFVLMIVQTPSWTGIAIAGVLFFTGFNYLEAKMPSMVSSISPAGSKGSAMGIYASHQFFGAFLGGLLSGILNSYFSAEYTFIMCVIVIFLLSLIAKGLTSVDKIKRVTLKLTGMSRDPQALIELRNALTKQEGVREVIIDDIDNAVYLKVDAKLFSLVNAQKLVSS